MKGAYTPFSSILIANRGEIACRIIRTAKVLGLRTIAVYSQADTNAPHVKLADEAIEIGPAPAGESYLSIERLMTAIKATKAEAVHPGYGFLSENAAFAEACAQKGIVFIGPNVDAINIMGDKAKAKRRMIEAGVSCVPGYQDQDQSDETFLKEAKKIGFPLMVKAAAGGGGRGMRLAYTARDLPSAIELARSEAQNAFGSGELILERAIIRPRHVEIQVVADKHGNVIHLGERDCSVQRRHQKVIEEAPCPVLTPEIRAKMGTAAVQAARNINYIGAGTVEFLLGKSGEFYFLEMNTRLQVEHPVTEMATGIDLVAMQIRVARGETLWLTQDDVVLNGHAIEARLYAENTSQGFLPATGPVDYWHPAAGDGIRIDSGIETGGEVTPFYDPMIAKVIAHGHTRDEARTKLVRALKNTFLFGVTTNKSFLIDALECPQFIAGEATTAFISENFSEGDLSAKAIGEKQAAIAALLLYQHSQTCSARKSLGVVSELLNWTSATPIAIPYKFSTDNACVEALITPMSVTAYFIECTQSKFVIESLEIKEHLATLDIDGVRCKIPFNFPVNDYWQQTIQFNLDGHDYTLTNLNGMISLPQPSEGAGSVFAPMHGILLDVFVQSGSRVSKGEKLAVLEAMKMQHELIAEIDGTVTEVNFTAGRQVSANALLMSIKIDE